MLLINAFVLYSYLKLGDHCDSTESLALRNLSFLVREDLMKKEIVRFLKQANELWWHRILREKTFVNTTRWRFGHSV